MLLNRFGVLIHSALFACALVLLLILLVEFLSNPTYFKSENVARRLAWKKVNSSFYFTSEILFPNSFKEFFPPARIDKSPRNEISNFKQCFGESFHEAWDRYKDLLRACPHHGFNELYQLDTFYNALNPTDQDSLNSAAGNLLERSTRDCLAADGNTFPEFWDNIQGYVVAAAGSGSLPSNTVANPRGKLKAITTRSGLVLDGPSVSMPPLFINPEEDKPSKRSSHVDISSHTDLTSPEVINPSSGNRTPVLEPVTKYSSSPILISIEESDLIWEEFEAYLASDSFPPGNSNPSSLLPPFHNFLSGSTTSSSPSLPIYEISDYFLEEFADELAHITFPPGNDDLPFDAESDLRELEYFLNHDPIKEMDSILEDSVDENSLDDNLVDTISEMFTDEHALDYSSPPLWDDYDDELFDLETVNDDTYDDPFYSKEEKIKDSKILIDELDLPGSSDFLPFPECDLVFYEDFSEVDALSSTNNEDKVFNPGILIHKSHFEVTNCATPEKNVKKPTNASLILEDFNPPLYELPFHKEVPGLRALLSFSSENKEKVFNHGIITS
ncbi:reverse transcriptase domain-containing protein [Tanacetum coccineum]|uniref:Reverse transcriptase domain-containing protein n=1 Tax=Tanacetum coccineum TaxID=301880 RepID=A0ABQ5FR68_9ASTR